MGAVDSNEFKRHRSLYGIPPWWRRANYIDGRCVNEVLAGLVMVKSQPEDPRLAQLTAVCLALPEVMRQRIAGHAEFRVRKKVFAYYLDDHHGDGIVAVCCKTPRSENADWVRSDPNRFYLPAYIGPRGWVGLRLDLGKVDWQEVADLVADSYRLTAPKRLSALVGRTGDAGLEDRE